MANIQHSAFSIQQEAAFYVPLPREGVGLSPALGPMGRPEIPIHDHGSTRAADSSKDPRKGHGRHGQHDNI